MNISDKINLLKPYVKGIRFMEGITLIDCVLKENWVVNKSDRISFAQNDTPNYYMFYSELDEVSIDELLNYVEYIINYNIEEENKTILLENKYKQLQIMFSKHSLVELQSLKFTINDQMVANSLLPELIVEKIKQDPIELEPIKQETRSVLDDGTEVKLVCRCKEGEKCSVCLGVD